jgi:flagellar hook-length control protein FliK
MDSSRIGQFFGLSPKIANPADNAGTDGKGGFADLLFGVMSKRVSTAKPALSATRVSTVLPMAEGSANAHAAPPLTRKLEAARLPGALARKDDAPATPPAAAEASAKAATDKAGADKIPADGAMESHCDLGEVVDAAPPAEGAASEDGASDEIDLNAEAENSESEQSDIGQDGGDQAPDQAATAIVIEPQVIVAAVPEGDATPVVASVLPAALPAAPESETALPAPAADGIEAMAAAQPQLSADAGQAQAEAAATAAAAQPETADTPAPADATPADADDSAAAQAAFAALALAADPSGDEAETQAAMLARQNERRGEDVAAMFRRPAQTPRERAAAASAGTTGTPAQAAASDAAKTPAVPAATAATAATTTATTALPLAPIGFDTGLGSAPGMPGWTLNLAQGNAARRPDFIANLRQHLQNLPAHEQMALGIQRSARDGGGRITLQLSPTELGRIHLKLDIDEEKNVRASVSVERPATLELLQRDTKALERALQDAGLKMDQNDLSFSLQGGDSDSFAREFGAEGRELADLLTDGAEDNLAPDMLAPAAVIATADGLVDVQI